MTVTLRTSGPERDPLRALLDACHLLTADTLAAAINEHAQLLGVRAAVVYLVDYEQALLLPVPGQGVPSRQELAIDRTVAGLAFRRVEVMDSPVQAHGAVRLWVPLLDGAERLGVLELLADVVTPTLEREARLLAALTAELIMSLGAYSDTFARLRRRRSMTLGAEIQWELLPPLTYGAERVVITGMLEPAYEIGGDTFDYAVNGDIADLLVLDAMGHGLGAALLASAAVGAYRHGRREHMELAAIASLVNVVVAEQFGPERFATGVLARLDLDTGRFRWINAGHPPPLILRGGSLMHPPQREPELPLGFQAGKPVCSELVLQPGDRVVLYTDGVVEARSPQGEFFGEQRLADLIVRSSAAGLAGPETVRRLTREILTHQADQLQDDASIVLLEWRTGDEQQLQI